MLLIYLLIYLLQKKLSKYLQYARSAVNYSFGESLYMVPSDMVLQIGTISGYNNNIQVAEPDQKLGLNEDEFKKYSKYYAFFNFRHRS